MSNILNIKLKGLTKNPKLKCNGQITRFYQDLKSLNDLEVFNRFVKACEKLVRNSFDYVEYRDNLILMGFDHCFIMPNITTPDAPIEMHHGPMLTLYDYCAIVTSHLIKSGERVTTFLVADIVLQEHYEHNVQIVMLCEDAHILFHNGDIFIHLNQAFGRVDKFLAKYELGVSDYLKRMICEYVEICKEYNSTDNGMFDINPEILECRNNTNIDYNFDLLDFDKSNNTIEEDNNIKQKKNDIIKIRIK